MSAYKRLTQNAVWMPKHPATMFNNWHGKIPQLNLLWVVAGDLTLQTFKTHSNEWNEVCKLCASEHQGQEVALLLIGTTPKTAYEVLSKAFKEGLHSDLENLLMRKLYKLQQDAKA